MLEDLLLTKVCSKCRLEKPLEDFGFSKQSKDGKNSWCKSCVNTDQNKKRAENPGYVDEVNKRRRDKLLVEAPEHRKARLQKLRDYRNEHKEEIEEARRKKYRDEPEYREFKIAETQAYYADHREEQIEKSGIRNKNRIESDIGFRLAARLRSRLGSAIRNKEKVGSFVRDLGCSIDELKKHLESKFQPGMTWETWGRGRGKWNIDHIVPLAAFDLTNRQHFVLACYYLNLQPLWFIDNQIKGSKYPSEG